MPIDHYHFCSSRVKCVGLLVRSDNWSSDRSGAHQAMHQPGDDALAEERARAAGDRAARGGVRVRVA